MAQKQTELAKAVHIWMTDEMHVCPQGRHVNSKLPTAAQLETVCRGKQMQDVWQFALERVRSSKTVKMVQGNLMLKRHDHSGGYKVQYLGNKRYSQERADLIAERKSLLSQLESEQTAAGYAEREIERLRSEVATTAGQYSDERNMVKAVNQKCALLKAHSGQVEEDVERFSEYAKRMDDKQSALLRHNNTNQLYSHSGRADGDKQQLETASTRAVRESCGVIAAFLHDLLQGSYSADKSLMYKEKENLWQAIENNMADFPPGQVIGSLELLSQTSALALREQTSKINIRNDAEKLKFKYENGRLLDTGGLRSTSLVQTVQQLVTERQGVHLQRFLTTEQCRNMTWRLQDRLVAVMELMEETLRGACQGDAGALKLAKTLFETEVDVAATRTALSVLDAAVENLLMELNEATKEKEAIYNKYQKIQDFKKLADSKQNLIRVLVRQNVSARQRLEQQQEDIAKYITSSLGDHAHSTKALTDELSGTVNSEVKVFAQLSLPFMMYSMLDSAVRLTVFDLSIHRLKVSLQPDINGAPQPGDQHAILQRVLTALEFPPQKAPEYLLPKVLQLQQLVDDLEATMAGQEALVRKVEGKDVENTPFGTTRTESYGQAANLEKVQDLCRKVREHDKEQIATLVPLLQQRLSRATQALTSCLKLRETCNDWWDQPAQTAADWIKVDGENLQQWRDKWTLAVTRLRQIQMGSS